MDDNGGQTKPILIQTIYDGLKKISGEIKVTKQMVGGAFGTLPIEKKKGDDPKAAARWTVSEATRVSIVAVCSSPGLHIDRKLTRHTLHTSTVALLSARLGDGD